MTDKKRNLAVSSKGLVHLQGAKCSYAAQGAGRPASEFSFLDIGSMQNVVQTKLTSFFKCCKVENKTQGHNLFFLLFFK